MNWSGLGKIEISVIDPSLQLQTREFMWQWCTLRGSKAYDFEKITIIKCEPYIYVVAEFAGDILFPLRITNFDEYSVS